MSLIVAKNCLKLGLGTVVGGVVGSAVGGGIAMTAAATLVTAPVSLPLAGGLLMGGAYKLDNTIDGHTNIGSAIKAGMIRGAKCSVLAPIGCPLLIASALIEGPVFGALGGLLAATQISENASEESSS